MANELKKNAGPSISILGSDGRPMPRVSARETSFGAASQEGKLRKWNPGRASADGHLLYEKDTIDDRARDMVRNEPAAKGAINSHLDLLVGTGPICRPVIPYRQLGLSREDAMGWQREVSNMFHRHVDTTDIDAGRGMTFTDMLRLWWRDRLSVGESAVLPLYLPDRVGVEYGLALQMIDPDRITNRDFIADTERHRSGIRFDEFNAPVEYDVMKVHPGDVGMFGAFESAWQWETIPARNEWGRPQFLHSFERLRPDQHRGQSIFAELMPFFKDISDYKQAEIKAALANALVAGVTQSSMPYEELLSLFGGDANQMMSERSEWMTDLKPGAILPLFPGETFTSHNPSRPNTAFAGFLGFLQKQISIGVDLPYEIMFKDFTSGSYSSIKAAFMSAWRSVDPKRDTSVTHFCQPVYEMWLEEAVSTGKVWAPGYWDNKRLWSQSKWLFPGRDWLDPVREGQAAQLRLSTGLSTFEHELAEQGKDWEDVFEQRAIEQERMRQLGLDPASFLTTIAIAPQVPVSDNPQLHKFEDEVDQDGQPLK